MPILCQNGAALSCTGNYWSILGLQVKADVMIGRPGSRALSDPDKNVRIFQWSGISASACWAPGQHVAEAER